VNHPDHPDSILMNGGKKKKKGKKGKNEKKKGNDAPCEEGDLECMSKIVGENLEKGKRASSNWRSAEL
jgi:hypothetical protein